MTTVSASQAAMLANIGLGVLEAVEAGGDVGAPASVLYAAMQAHGATFNQFMSFMSGMIRPGYLTLEDDCYRSTPTTRELKAKLQRTIAAVNR